MAVTNKTRKLLWGRSASRCAICRADLVYPGTADSGEAVVGDECHIVAQSPGGPRYRRLLTSEVDGYANLVLLCRNHHKLVDDQPETYTEPLLRRLKANHERWIASTLGTADAQEAGSSSPRYRVRLLSGGEEILDVVAGVHAYDFNHDPLEDEDEVALVAGFLQSAHDWGEIWNDIESGGHVEARFHLGKQLQELRGHGFLVYGAETIRSIRVNGKQESLSVAILRVLRQSNPTVPEHHRRGTSSEADPSNSA